MTYFLDTNAFSDLLREHPKTQARVQALPAGLVFISTIVRGEVLFGVARLPPGKKRADLEDSVLRLLSALVCEPVPAGAADIYAAIKAEAQQRGVALNENDLWIAATAMPYGATLVTRDGDFQHVTGLSVEDWSV